MVSCYASGVPLFRGTPDPGPAVRFAGPVLQNQKTSAGSERGRDPRVLLIPPDPGWGGRGERRE